MLSLLSLSLLLLLVKGINAVSLLLPLYFETFFLCYWDA